MILLGEILAAYIVVPIAIVITVICIVNQAVSDSRRKSQPENDSSEKGFSDE